MIIRMLNMLTALLPHALRVTDFVVIAKSLPYDVVVTFSWSTNAHLIYSPSANHAYAFPISVRPQQSIESYRFICAQPTSVLLLYIQSIFTWNAASICDKRLEDVMCIQQPVYLAVACFWWLFGWQANNYYRVKQQIFASASVPFDMVGLLLGTAWQGRENGKASRLVDMFA